MKKNDWSAVLAVVICFTGCAFWLAWRSHRYQAEIEQQVAAAEQQSEETADLAKGIEQSFLAGEYSLRPTPAAEESLPGQVRQLGGDGRIQWTSPDSPAIQMNDWSRKPSLTFIAQPEWVPNLAASQGGASFALYRRWPAGKLGDGPYFCGPFHNEVTLDKVEKIIGEVNPLFDLMHVDNYTVFLVNRMVVDDLLCALPTTNSQ